MNRENFTEIKDFLQITRRSDARLVVIKKPKKGYIHFFVWVEGGWVGSTQDKYRVAKIGRLLEKSQQNQKQNPKEIFGINGCSNFREVI